MANLPRRYDARNVVMRIQNLGLVQIQYLLAWPTARGPALTSDSPRLINLKILAPHLRKHSRITIL